MNPTASISPIETTFSPMGVIKQIPSHLASVACAIARVVKKIILYPYHQIAQSIVRFSAFNGFSMSESTKTERREELIRTMGAEKLTSEIDALYIPSRAESKTGNVVIFVLARHFQRFHPRNFEYILEAGADVILFNPSEKTVKGYENDLTQVIQEIQEKYPEKKIALHGYCIGAHVATAVAGKMSENSVDGVEAKSLPVIVDRGFGDANQVANHLTLGVARLNDVKNLIRSQFNSHAEPVIHSHKTGMLFIAPKDGRDLLLQGRGRNFTQELMKLHGHDNDRMVILEKGSHCSRLTEEARGEIISYLRNHEIIQ